MNPERRYKINRQNVVFELFDDEVVIINLENGNYYSFNGAGIMIWKLISEEASLGEIFDLFRNKYKKKDPESLEVAIGQSITELEFENLIVEDESGRGEFVRKSFNVSSTKKISDNEVFKKPELRKYTDMQDFLLVDPIHEIDYEKWPKK